MAASKAPTVDKNMAKTESVLERLSERFPAEKVKKNPKGQDYVGIADYLDRLDDVLGTDWSQVITASSVEHSPYKYGSKGHDAFLAQVTVQIIVTLGDGNTLVRSGVGADFSNDADKSLKTAQAEALKKAAHQLGVCRYLWSEEERDLVQAQREANDGDISNLKKKVTLIFKQENPGVAVNKDNLAEYFKVNLDDPEELARIIKENM
jgi:hypothetical protein